MKDQLFKSWVPKWMKIAMLIFIFFPAMLINGTYGGNAAEMMSGLGIISEHLIFANLLSAIGLVVAGPFLIPILKSYSSRAVYLIGFTLMCLMCYISGTTTNMLVLFACSFLIGLVRVCVMLNNIFGFFGTIAGVDVLEMLSIQPTSPEEIAKKNRSQGIMQCCTYFLFLTIGQVASYMSVKIAYQFNWQYAYWYSIGLAAIAMLLVVILLKEPSGMKKGKLENLPDIKQAITAAFFISSFCYILVYGKTYDWFDDTRICWALAITLFSGALLMIQYLTSKKKYLIMDTFSIPGVMVAILFLTLVSIINSSSVIVTTLMGMSMTLDPEKSIALTNWHIVGFAIGMIFNLTLILKGVRPKWFLVMGFSLIVISAVYMYFHIQPIVTYESMILPTILRSTGMWIIYTYCGYSGMSQLNIGRQLGTWVFIMLVFRSVIGPACGNALYSNAMNIQNRQHIERIAHDYDRVNPELTKMPVATLSATVQKQSMYATLKELSGFTIYGGVFCVFLALIFPYSGFKRKEKTEPVPI